MVGRTAPDPGCLAARVATRCRSRPSALPYLGRHWSRYQCTRTAGDVNGQLVAPLPGWLAVIGQEIIARRDGRSWPAATARAAVAAT